MLYLWVVVVFQAFTFELKKLKNVSLSLYWLIQCSRHYRREILLTVCTVWTRVNCKNWLCRDENELWHKPAGRKRRQRRNHILCPKVQPLIKFFLVYCLLIHLCHVAPQIYRWRAEFLSSLWASDICHKDSESFSFVQLRDLARQSLLCCVVFRGQAGRRGTCSCRCSVPALHHNKGNLNAVLFYGHCCKILLGHCGPYETESCQIHREESRLWIERDGLFMLASYREL